MGEEVIFGYKRKNPNSFLLLSTSSTCSLGPLCRHRPLGLIKLLSLQYKLIFLFLQGTHGSSFSVIFSWPIGSLKNF